MQSRAAMIGLYRVPLNADRPRRKLQFLRRKYLIFIRKIFDENSQGLSALTLRIIRAFAWHVYIEVLIHQLRQWREMSSSRTRSNDYISTVISEPSLNAEWHIEKAGLRQAFCRWLAIHFVRTTAQSARSTSPSQTDGRTDDDGRCSRCCCYSMLLLSPTVITIYQQIKTLLAETASSLAPPISYL